MAPPQDRSCYVLELSVGPGGSRWAELHAYSNLDHIRACLDVFLENGGGMSAYHAIWYGATLGIWTVQRGNVVGFLDLHSFLQVRLGDGPAVPLSDTAAARALVYERRRQRYLDDGEDEEDIPGEDDHDDDDWNTYEAMTLAVDWGAVTPRLPALEPPSLAPGERAKLDYSKWRKSPKRMYAGEGSIRFGSYDPENGERLDPPFKIEMPEPGDEEEDEDDDD
ncbi:hypothetical protein [Polyangium sp. 15x6]|uniref:hypothetical protein n=1 Tax=Polyangium sp. 15x6 TaxID=3042687 RepID=UPI00249C3ED5|nr:hypothetical protein [Polyangium sp. 15x6]MDI3283730.1 hypothetical protein [Polyangium sp. 15x6]